MTYKCKICGGETTLDMQNGIAICDYCGTKQALPLFSDDSERLLYESGNNYLAHSEYDKAENVFNQLLTIKPNAAELYWDLVLCKYGVTYVKDPATEKYIPTCNRTHYTPIFSDENYKKAVELSAGEKKALFEEDAKTIDNIQKGILAVSKKEKPFDIFISYKETDQNRERTKDSIAAQKLYQKLTDAGYKVFFSRITLEDKVGSEYEPYIYAALYSSKVMLTVCSSKENIEAVWVKNEWSRYLTLRQADSSKTVLPLYFDMDKSDLPEEFALLSCYDMSADGFEDELLRGIKKLIPTPIMKAAQRKRTRKLVAITAACVSVVAIAGTALLLPRLFSEQNYAEAMTLFNNAQYEEAAKGFKQLGGYKDSKEMVTKCALQPDYNKAVQLYHEGRYAEAAWAFGELGDFEDAKEQKEKAERSWRYDTAVVMVQNGYSVYSNNVRYYITNNGTVKSEGDGIALQNIPYQEHGKAASLGMGSAIGVVHEDGFVSGITTKDSCENIIKLSGEIAYSYRWALCADGTMRLLTVSEDSYDDSDWPTAFANLKDVVDFEFFNEGFYQDTQNEMIIAITKDGKLHGYMASLVESDKTSVDYKKVLAKFSNVKSLKFVGPHSASADMQVVALTHDGKLQIYKDGKFTEKDGKNIADIISVNHLLTNTGDVIALDGHKVYQKDIIYGDVVFDEDMVYVSRSGVINNDKKMKTVAREEWIARLD